MAKSDEFDQIDSKIHKILAKLDEIKQIDSRIHEIMDNVPPALSNLKKRMSLNTAYFKNPVLSDKNYKLSFSFYSIKFEITAHIKLNNSPDLITQGVLRTSVYDETQMRYIHKPGYDMTIDIHGNIDTDFGNDNWAEHYFDKVIWNFYNTATEITLS
jgi:hypothetical protein